MVYCFSPEEGFWQQNPSSIYSNITILFVEN